MAFGFSGGSAENIRPRPPLREDFAVIREEPNLRIAFSGDPEEQYEVERVDADGGATVVGSSSSPDILVPSRPQEHRVVAKNQELGIRGTPSVPKRELKPTHRWQMPLPRNLLDDPESFDPGSTAWRKFGLTYNGTVGNVGPNGETAHSFTVDNDGADLKQDLADVDAPLTAGAFVRAKSSQFSASTIFRNTDIGTSFSKSVTVSTYWSWVTSTNTSQDDVDELRLFDDLPSGRTFYILRAVLNRGSSRLFSTRSQVPQTIPDVVQGADLTNGSTSGPDTNDLDFGVDESGRPFIVGDGDDNSGPIPVGSRENISLAFRYYQPPKGSYTNKMIGNRSEKWTLYSLPIFNDFRIEGFDEDGNVIQCGTDGFSNNGGNYDGWNTVVVTIDAKDGDLRLNLNGNVFRSDTGAGLKDYTGSDFPLFRDEYGGYRMMHPEIHPVLTPAEAEAVRQRLATNPADPVPPTEAWDFTAETNPHNYITNSEDAKNAEVVAGVNITDNVGVDSTGEMTMDRLEEDTSDGFHGIDYDGDTRFPGTATAVFEVREEDRQWVFVQCFDTGPNFTKQWFDLTNNQKGSATGATGQVIQATITKIGNGLQRLSMTYQAADGEKFRAAGLFLAEADGIEGYVGDGSSSVQVGRRQVVRGDEAFPPYTPTNGSIAFPQTVPALRDSSNDLTLGSTSGADTSDPDWVAPVGVVTDGDDRLDVPPETLTQEATWTHAFRQIRDKLQFRVGPVQLKDKFNINIAIQDVKGSLYTLSSSGVIFDDNKHVYTLVYSEAKRIVRLYLDGNIVFDVDLDEDTSLDALNPDAYTNFLDNSGGNAVHENLIHYSRVLTAEEIAYDAERLLDNPETAFPNYTTP